MTDRREFILQCLFRIHRELRLNRADVSRHTKSADQITKKWQKKVEDKLKGICSEMEVHHEKIDLVDLSEHTAYEVKVSGKNPHHEFYKDIFKVLVYNEENENSKIETFVFISEQSGIEALRKRAESVVELMRKKHSLSIEFESIPVY